MQTKTFLTWAAFAGVTISHGQVLTTITAPNGSAFTVNSGSYTNTATSGVQGSANFVPIGGTDYNFRYSFAYRQTGDTREYAVSASGSTFSNTADSWTGVINRNVMNTGVNTLEFTVNHRILDLTATSPLLVSTVTVRNLDTIDRGVTLFNYADWDVPGTSGDSVSNVNLGAGMLGRQTDTVTGNFAETYAEGATRVRHGALYSTLFSNALIDNLDNSVSALTGDFGMGFQWDERTIVAGGSTTYRVYTSLNNPVPEPATLLTLGVGSLLALRRRRKA